MNYLMSIWKNLLEMFQKPTEPAYYPTNTPLKEHVLIGEYYPSESSRKWVQILFEGATLDEDAFYYYLLGHDSAVLYTRLNWDSVRAILSDRDDTTCELRGDHLYRFLVFRLLPSHPEYGKMGHAFIVELQRPAPRTRK